MEARRLVNFRQQLKHAIEGSSTGRLALLPLRLKIAIGYYLPKLGAITGWAIRSREYTNFTYEYSPANLQYLAHTLAIVTGCPVAALRDFLAEPTNNAELHWAVRERGATSGRRAVIDRDLRLGKQRVWYALARALKPGVVVEAGVGLGLAALVLAEALLKNAADGQPGRYIGIDQDPRAGVLLGPRQQAVARMMEGDSVNTLRELRETVDLFITDTHVSPELEYAECRAVEPRLAERAVVATTMTTLLPVFAEETGRDFLAFKEEPRDHWYPGGWIGLAFRAPAGGVVH